MGEAVRHNQPVHRIYLGEGKPEKPAPEKSKADTLYNRTMQEVFDVIAFEAVRERHDVMEAQGEIADITARLITSKKNAWERYTNHKNLNTFIREQDREWRGRELPHKLDRILVMTALGGASALIDYAGDAVGTTLLAKTGTGSIPGVPMDEADTNGNRKALKAGWEMITDELIGAFANQSVRVATNRREVGFVSPLSESLARVGAIVTSFAFPEEKTRIQRFVNSVINPATIEAGIRGLAAIPLVGAGVENAYIALNKSLLRKEGLFPFGFQLAATMLAAKDSQMSKVKDVKKVIALGQS